MSWLMLIPALAVGFLFGQLLAIFQVQHARRKTRECWEKEFDRYQQVVSLEVGQLCERHKRETDRRETLIKQQQDMLNAAVAQVEFVRDRLAELMVKFATKESN